MENKHIALDLPHDKLLPVDRQWCTCHKHKTGRNIITFANGLKAFAVLTVVVACFTSVSCAVYCNASLRQVRAVQTDIVRIQSSLSEGPGDGGVPTASRLTDSKERPSDSDRDTLDRASYYGDNDSGNEGVDDDDDKALKGSSDSIINYLHHNEFDDDYGESDDEFGDDYGEGHDKFDDSFEDEFEDESDYDELYDDSAQTSTESYANIDETSPVDDINDDSRNSENLDVADVEEGVENGSGFLSDDEDIGRVRRSVDTSNNGIINKKGTSGQGKKRGQGKNKGKGRKGRKQNISKAQRPRKQRTKKLKSLPAAQFSANMTEKKLIELGIGMNSYELTGECKYDSGMGGTYCRNKTFTPERRRPLRIFKKEDWVNDAKSPVTMDNNRFVVKSSGTHIVYAQMMLEGNMHPVSASIVRERLSVEDQSLTCTNDCINNNPKSDMTFRCTCSIFGLMNLREQDKLYIRVNNGLNTIIFEEAKTYMGVVQLNRD